MRKFTIRSILFLLAFFALVSLIPRSDIEGLTTEVLLPEEVTEAIEQIDFYSSYNYQTITEEKLNRITTDFYLPVEVTEISVTYLLDSEYLSLSEETEIIELRTGNIEVIKVSVEKLPSVIKGDQSFEIIATFYFENNNYIHSFSGYVIPVIPDDFLGGSLYTVVTYGSMFVEGALLTLGLSLTGTIIGFVIALFLATARIIEITPQDGFMRKSIKKGVNRLSSLYITLFRGTPMIVQASFFWYGFGLFGNPLLCGLFVVSLNTAAYIAEIIRGSVNAIDKGQIEASLSVGLSYSQTMIFVVFPQAIKNAMPAIGNEFVINIKDTAVLSVIGIFELFNQTKKITGMHYRQLEAYAIVALIYLFLTYSITSLLKYVEKRMGMRPLELVSSN